MAIPILSANGVLNSKAVRLSEILKDFDSTLELRWIPSVDRTIFDSKPYAVWQVSEQFAPYPIMYLSEDELDHRVLEALLNADVSKNNLLTRLERGEKAKELFELKERMDRQEEDKKFSTWALRTNRTVKHNGVTYS